MSASEEDVKSSPGGGTLLFAGATDWALINRGGGKGAKKKDPAADAKRAEQYPNLLSPTRLKVLHDVKIMWVAAGPSACHSVIGDSQGRCWTWGRNEKGQLGLGDLAQRNQPVVVPGLGTRVAISGSCGKHHTVVAFESGESFAWGSNLSGQCGTGSIKSKDKQEELLMSPVRAMVDGCSKVACGLDFTIWMCKQRLWTSGNPQYGQLGHGTDHEYNARDSSVKIQYQPQPTPKAIAALAGSTIIAFAAGQNHCIAVDDTGSGYTWGNGGYGRVGHKVQVDCFTPKKLEALVGRVTAPTKAADAKVAAGSTSSFCTTNIAGALYAWGKLKVSGDNTMYPRPFEGLTGWNIKDIACGAQHYVVSAHYMGEHSAISWGHATGGELAYGPGGKKSSAQPDKVPALEGMDTIAVAAGQAHSLFLVDSAAEGLLELSEWEPETESEEAPALPPGAAGKAKGGKRKAAGDKPSAKKGKK